jgi:hypothetical protein
MLFIPNHHLDVGGFAKQGIKKYLPKEKFLLKRDFD